MIPESTESGLSSMKFQSDRLVQLLTSRLKFSVLLILTYEFKKPAEYSSPEGLEYQNNRLEE